MIPHAHGGCQPVEDILHAVIGVFLSEVHSSTGFSWESGRFFPNYCSIIIYFTGGQNPASPVRIYVLYKCCPARLVIVPKMPPGRGPPVGPARALGGLGGLGGGLDALHLAYRLGQLGYVLSQIVNVYLCGRVWWHVYEPPGGRGVWGPVIFRPAAHGPGCQGPHPTQRPGLTLDATGRGWH